MLLVFLMASVIAITLYFEIPRISMQTQRDKEQVLIDRGEQYKRAIQLFVKKAGRYPGDIKELESFQNQRFLRQRYADPMTGKDEWRLIHIQNGILTDSKISKPPGPGDKKDGGGSTAGQFVGEQLAMGATGTQQGGGAQNVRDRRRPSEGGNATTPAGGLPGGSMPGGSMPGGNMPGGNMPGGDLNAAANPGAVPAVPALPGQQPVPPTTGYPGGQQTGLQGQPQFPTGVPMPGPNGQPGMPTMSGMPVIPGQPGFGRANPSGTMGATANTGNSFVGGGGAYVGGGGSYVGGGAVTGATSGVPSQAGPQYPGQAQFPGQTQYPGQTQFPGQPGPPASSQTFGGTPAYPTTAGSQGPPVGFPQPGTTTTGQPNAAADMIRNILTTPRPGGMPTGNVGGQTIGGGIAGVASNSEGEGVKVYNDHSLYAEWEFIFDPQKQKQIPNPNAQGAGANGTPADRLGTPAGQGPGQNGQPLSPGMNPGMSPGVGGQGQGRPIGR
jgi:hypothetical protein